MYVGVLLYITLSLVALQNADEGPGCEVHV